MKNAVLLFLVALSGAINIPSFLNAQPSKLLPDSSGQRIIINDAGISVRVCYFNAFAPEWYMQGFSLNPSPEISFKRQINQNGFRAGYLRMHEEMITYGGKWMESSISSGHLSGSIIYAGIFRELVKKKSFRFYAGIDASIAHFTFDGFCESYNGLSRDKENKKFSGIALSPYAGISLNFLHRFRISMESSFDNWRITERDKIIDPDRIEIKHSFVSSPNPISAVTLSFIF